MPGKNIKVPTGANKAAVPDFPEWTDLRGGDRVSASGVPEKLSCCSTLGQPSTQGALTRVSFKADHSPPSPPLLCRTPPFMGAPDESLGYFSSRAEASGMGCSQEWGAVPANPELAEGFGLHGQDAKWARKSSQRFIILTRTANPLIQTENALF